MKFTTVDMLYLLWTIPIFLVLYAYGMKRRKQILKKYAASLSLKYLCPDTLNHRRWVKMSLVLGGVILMVLAMSGPQYGYKWKTMERKGIDIIIALDCSKSMLATDVNPTRLERAKREIRDLLGLLQGDRVGLISFAGTAFLNCPLTLDYHSFFIFADHLSPEYLPVGGTDLSTALETALSAFDPEMNTEKAVILITDGEHTGQASPTEAAASLNKNKIKLFCIGVGKKEGVPVPEKGGGFKKNRSGGIVLSKLDEMVLQQMALSTGGAYVRSITGDMDLETIYLKEIKGKMARATLSDNRLKVWENRYQWPLALAILLLVWAFLLPVGKPGKDPNRKKLTSMLIKGLKVMLTVLLISRAPNAYAGSLEAGADAYEKGAYETALKLFIEAQLKDPQNPEVLYNIGNAYYKIGDYQSAYDYFKEAGRTQDDALKQKTVYNMGNTSFRQGRLKEAIEHYKQALEMDPEDTSAKENIDYVKKVMKQQKNQQNSGESGDDKEEGEDQSRQSSGGTGNKGEDKNGEEGQKDRQDTAGEKQNPGEQETSQFGDRMPQNQTGQSEDGDSSVQSSPPEQQEGDMSARDGSDEQDRMTRQQMERVLNRLKDRPGQTTMPSDEGQAVDQDW